MKYFIVFYSKIDNVLVTVNPSYSQIIFLRHSKDLLQIYLQHFPRFLRISYTILSIKDSKNKHASL